MFCRLPFSVLVLAFTLLSHFAGVLAMPMGIGGSLNRWGVLAASTGHTPGQHINPGTFLPGDELASSRTNFQKGTSNSTSDGTSAGPDDGGEPNSNDESGAPPHDNTNAADDDSASNPSGGEISDDNTSPASALTSTESSTPPLTKTNAALPGNMPTVLLPLTVTVLCSLGLF